MGYAITSVGGLWELLYTQVSEAVGLGKKLGSAILKWDPVVL